MPYRAEALNGAAFRHACYYATKLENLRSTYASTPENVVPQLRKLLPQIQQAHTWLLTHHDTDPAYADRLVSLTMAGIGCVRMVVSPAEWEAWVTVGVEVAASTARDLDRLSLIIEQGTHAFRQGDMDSAEAAAARGIDEAAVLDAPAQRAQCYYLQALVYQKRGDTQRAQAAIERAQHDYECVGDTAGIGKVRSFLAQAAIDALDYERAHALLQQNIELWEQTGNLRQMAVEQYQLGVMLSNRLMFDEADDYLLAARAAFQKLADRRYEAYSLQILSSNYTERGALDEALACIEDAHDLFLAVNDRRGVAGSLNYMGRIHDKLGDFARAVEKHQQAADVANAIDYRFALTDAYRSLCEIHLKTGALSAAQESIGAAVRVGEASGNRLLMLAVLAAAVGVLAADDQATHAADVALTIQVATDEPLILQMLAPHLAAVETERGTPIAVAEAAELIKKLYF